MTIENPNKLPKKTAALLAKTRSRLRTANQGKGLEVRKFGEKGPPPKSAEQKAASDKVYKDFATKFSASIDNWVKTGEKGFSPVSKQDAEAAVEKSKLATNLEKVAGAITGKKESVEEAKLSKLAASLGKLNTAISKPAPKGPPVPSIHRIPGKSWQELGLVGIADVTGEKVIAGAANPEVYRALSGGALSAGPQQARGIALNATNLPTTVRRERGQLDPNDPAAVVPKGEVCSNCRGPLSAHGTAWVEDSFGKESHPVTGKPSIKTIYHSSPQPVGPAKSHRRGPGAGTGPAGYPTSSHIAAAARADTKGSSKTGLATTLGRNIIGTTPGERETEKKESTERAKADFEAIFEREENMNPDTIANKIIREAFTSGDRRNTTPNSNGMADKGGTARLMLSGEWFGSTAWPFDQSTSSDFEKSAQLQATQAVAGQGEGTSTTPSMMDSVSARDIVDNLLEDSPASIYDDPQSVGYMLRVLDEAGYTDFAKRCAEICENATEETVVEVSKMVEKLEADKADPYLVEGLQDFAALIISENEGTGTPTEEASPSESEDQPEPPASTE